MTSSTMADFAFAGQDRGSRVWALCQRISDTAEEKHWGRPVAEKTDHYV